MNKFLKYIAINFSIISAMIGLNGCTAIMDDEPEPCPSGIEVRFIYDYNLERANAFPAQVECLVLHIYDSEGKHVKTLTENSDILSDEDYRMRINDLPEGEYTLVAYGGTTCEKASITHTNYPVEGQEHYLTDLGMKLNDECLEPGNPAGRLHDHFYGTLNNVIVKVQPNLQKVTVKMMKNTNHFRIILQHLSYEPLDGNDYEFEIVDDNTLFAHNNDLVKNGDVSYSPWGIGSVSTGDHNADNEDETRAAITEVKVAYADLSTSRLMKKNNPKLIVTHKESGTEVINIALNNYLLAMRSDYYDWCGEQEFLDRKSEWPMVFFLDDDRHWNKTYIKVDNWIVRVNEITQ
ncbi:MAG: FimB/Mfa2 family fimbrial subunit [Muribaculaceae bacterium]|nr:FimB/Mfa2 family fimbrial subunit [Muribaculaceae bacterium]